MSKSLFGLAVPIIAAPPMLVVAACEANSPLGLSRVKRQARLVLVTMGKCPCVLDAASEPALMDTRLDLVVSSKEGTLVISSMNRKHIRSVGSKNNSPKGTGLRKLAPGGKRCVPKSMSASRKLQLQLVVAGDGAGEASPCVGSLLSYGIS
jgi:hypothetical protein